MNKVLSTILFILFIGFQANAQMYDPVKWKTKIEKISESEYKLYFDATIEGEWHMYSQFTPEGGPLPLEFIYHNEKGNFAPQGKAKESAYQKKFNDIFEVDEYYFAKSAQFSHQIKINNPEVQNIQVELSYQACIDMCIQLNKFFVFDLKTLTATEVQNFENIPTQNVAATNVESDTLKKNTSTPQPIKTTEKKDDKSIWSIFIFSFLGGLTALLTPCVFPMIPMTVSFFTKQSKTRAKGIKNALIYGISIIFIYVFLGFIISKLFGVDALNALSSSVAFNVIFFIILVVFAISFLGAFEIMLPNSWANKIDRQADRGGIVGIFFMALALAIVSFSCTGPIVGSLLVNAVSIGGIAPFIGMFGFSLALALPFMFFAMFPGYLNSLPKSGGWMNAVKVSLGFLELAFAFKFLSNADLVLQMHLLEREVFIAIWIAIFATWAIYLFGKIQLPHDSAIQKISVGRALLGVFVLAFTIYMVPGLWGAPLKILSGMTPPMNYAESPKGIGGATMAANQIMPTDAKEGVHGIPTFTDYEKGMAYAKEVGKPVLLDFTGYTCVNCRKMEDHVWPDKSILPILKDKVVLISLYMDDKKNLPENEQYVSKISGKKVITLGNKWSDMQIEKFQTNAQPLYIILDNEGNNLNEPVGYTPDVNEYFNWLNSGLEKYNK